MQFEASFDVESFHLVFMFWTKTFGLSNCLESKRLDIFDASKVQDGSVQVPH